MQSTLAFIAKHLFSFFSSVFLKFSVCTNDLTPKQVNVLLINFDMCIQQEAAFSSEEVCGGEEILRLFRGFLAGVITGFVIHVQYP